MHKLIFVGLSIVVSLLTSVKSAEAQNIYWANGTSTCADLPHEGF